jgi:hypothetical protein
MSHKCVAATEYIFCLDKLSENCHTLCSVIDSMAVRFPKDFITLHSLLSSRCISAALALFTNATNVDNRFGAFGNRPSGSANVSIDDCEMFGRKVWG